MARLRIAGDFVAVESVRAEGLLCTLHAPGLDVGIVPGRELLAAIAPPEGRSLLDHQRIDALVGDTPCKHIADAPLEDLVGLPGKCAHEVG